MSLLQKNIKNILLAVMLKNYVCVDDDFNKRFKTYLGENLLIV